VFACAIIHTKRHTCLDLRFGAIHSVYNLDENQFLDICSVF
jgi:hypothetical protein